MKQTGWKETCRKIGQTCKARPTFALRYDVAAGFYRAKDDVNKGTPTLAKAEKGDLKIDLIRTAAFLGTAALALLLLSRNER